MKRKFFLWVVVLGVVMAGVLAACGGGRTETPSPTQPLAAEQSPGPAPVADGATLLQERCTACHTLERVESAHKSAEEWEQTVSRMVGRGAQLTAEEKTVLVEYLATHYR
jgi:cytochrome c5